MSTQVEEALQALGARLRGFREDAGFAGGPAFARATSWQCEKTGQGDQLGDLVAIVRHVDELWLEWRRQLQTGVEKRQRQAIPVYAKTKVFRIWHPTLIWGTLQTADYAAEVFQQGNCFSSRPRPVQRRNDSNIA